MGSAQSHGGGSSSEMASNCSVFKSSYCGASESVLMHGIRGAWPMSDPISPQTFDTTGSSRSGAGASSRKDSSSCGSELRSHHYGPVIQYHSHTHVLPVIMPSSHMKNNKSSCHQESEIEMVVFQPSMVDSPVQCRVSVNAELKTPPTTCVPWLRKIKVIKKIQRKIGRGRNEGMSPNNMPPLHFHAVCGDNVTVNQSRTVARRTNSFCQAIVFSDRPVKISEKVYIKLVEVATSWSGALRFGFTTKDPASLKGNLPRYVVPDLTNKKGFWAKAFSDTLVKKDATLFFFVDSAGDVHFGINGVEKDIFFSGVDTRGPLWAVIDIYGNTTCLEFVDPRAHLNNSRRCVNEEIESRLSEVVPPLDGLKIGETLPVVQSGSSSSIQELNFHRVRGKNVIPHSDAFSNIAFRQNAEYYNAYVFTARPIQPDETFIIQILKKEEAYSGSMGFGLTSCNPQSISSDTLPADSNLLLDRPEYWVVKQDVANSPNAHDIIAFTLSSTGEVTMSVNGGQPTFQMNVDITVPLWAFFDLYGNTEGIRCVGSIVHNNAYSASAAKHQSCSSVPGPSKLPSTSKSAFSSSSYNISKNKVLPSPSSSSTGSSFELSHSPNSMSAAISLRAHETCSFGAANGGKEITNWSIECVACCERPVDSVFYSCGHMCMCYNCAIDYWRSKEKGCCPICRAIISDVIRTYKS